MISYSSNPDYSRSLICARARANPFLKLLIISSTFFVLVLLDMHPSPAYAQNTFYTIHVSSYRIHQNAIKKVSRLEKFGFEAFYRYEYVKGKAMWYRVYIGRFGSKNEAKKKAEALRLRKVISYYDIAAMKEDVSDLADKILVSPVPEEKTPETTDTEETTEAQLPEKATEKDRQQLISIHGFAKNETAYRIHSPSEFTKIKNILFLSTEGKLTPTIGYKASGRAYYDAVFDVTNTYTEKVERDEEDDIELRDTYLDFSIGNLDLRVGKQQIVWGEAVGLFFADIVNPKDLREFVLPDLDQIRIPVWAADIEYYMGGNHLELVWIPILEFNKTGISGSEFEFYTTPAPGGALIHYESEKEPSNDLKNSECGIRLSRFMAGWDLNVFYFYGYDYFPAPFRTIGIDPLTSQTTLTVKPEYKRLDIFALTFSKEVKDIIFKGEFICNNGKYFQVNDLADTDGVVKKDFIDYLIGADYTFFEKIDINVQFMQRIIFNYNDIMVTDRIKTSFSCWLKTGFFDNTLEPELFFVSSLREKDLMFRPKVSYKFKDNWKAVLGVDAFEGKPDGEFGQFDTKDRLYMEVRYDF